MVDSNGLVFTNRSAFNSTYYIVIASNHRTSCGDSTQPNFFRSHKWLNKRYTGIDTCTIKLRCLSGWTKKVKKITSAALNTSC